MAVQLMAVQLTVVLLRWHYGGQLTVVTTVVLTVATSSCRAVEMIEGFGGAVFEKLFLYLPSRSEVWAGFANLNEDIYPFTFANGGTITFTAAVPAGGS